MATRTWRNCCASTVATNKLYGKLASMKFGAHCSTAGGVWKALSGAGQLAVMCAKYSSRTTCNGSGSPIRRPGPRVLCERTGGEFLRLRLRPRRLPHQSRRAAFGEPRPLHSVAHSGNPACGPARASLSGAASRRAPGRGRGGGPQTDRRRPGRGLRRDQNVAGAHRPREHRRAGDLPGKPKSSISRRSSSGSRQPERLGVCLDTAHFFAAGYDIRTPKGWNAAIREVASLIGLKQILAFHLNDSKTGLGSRVDRHEHIGKGKIGKEAFRHIVSDARFKNHPGCLETPKSDDLHEDVQNLATLRSLAKSGRSVTPPAYGVNTP